MRIVFWGTPDFAVPSLRALLGEGFDVVGVVTRPDRPQGRSRSRLVPSPIKTLALSEGLTVLEPERPRGSEFLDTLSLLAPDISVVVAYGHILVRDVIDAPTRGTINVHASLLPALRGAAPIQAAIREGLEETGVSIMRIVPALDAGPVILQMATPIAADETYGELQLRLSELGAQALIEGLALIELGASVERPQDDARATYAPKVDRNTATVVWTESSDAVARLIRSCDPRPGAHTSTQTGTQTVEVKLFGAQSMPEHDRGGAARAIPGTVTNIDGQGITIECGTGAVRVAQVQPAGRPRMSPAEWARGRGVKTGDRFA